MGDSPPPSDSRAQPQPPPDADPDRRTHTTHTINVPYRDARSVPRPQQPQRPPPPAPSEERQACPRHGPDNVQHYSRDPPKIAAIPRITGPAGSTLPPSQPAEAAAAAAPATSSSSSSTPPAPVDATADKPPSSSSPEPTTPPTTTDSSTSQDRDAKDDLAEGLEGRYVDEFGNILEWDGTVLGRVEGDLPSMIGRPVSANGDIFDTDGDDREVVGHVSENYILQQRQQEEEERKRKARIPPLHNLDGGMRVDAAGNIYNAGGHVVGRLNEPPPQAKQDKPKHGENSEHPCSCREPDRAAAAAPNPSEIYLDVKSTYDGIQLIIKIPTVFNRDLIDQERREG